MPPGPDSIPAAQYDTLIPAVTDTAILATGLMEKHWYYFGAQVLQNALWSKVTDSASAKDSTPASLDTSTMANTIKILKCTFDTTRNAPFVVWHVDTLDTNIKVGIEYSLNNYPLNPATAPTQIITVKSKTDSAAVKLNGTLALNATYYVSMWMYRNGKWAASHGLVGGEGDLAVVYIVADGDVLQRAARYGPGVRRTRSVDQ